MAAFGFLGEQTLFRGEVLPREILAEGFVFEGQRVPRVSHFQTRLFEFEHPGPRACRAFDAFHGPIPVFGTPGRLARFMKGRSSVEAIQNAHASRGRSCKEGHRMRTTDELTMEIQVGPDAARSSVELKIAATAGEDARIVHLSRDEARRLAALLLFQAARLDRSQVSWRLPHADLVRRSA